MSNTTKLLHDVPDCCPLSLALRLALELEALPIPREPTDVGEPQEVERFRLALAASDALFRYETAELNQARLLWVQTQCKFGESLLQIIEEAFRIRPALEADNGVSRAAEFHHRALAEPDVRLSPHPAPIVRPRP